MTDRGVTVSISTSSIDGTPAELTAQISQTRELLGRNQGLRITSTPAQIRSAEGDAGLLVRYRTTTTSDGAVAGYVIDETGVALFVSGPPNAAGTASQQAATMLSSVARSGGR